MTDSASRELTNEAWCVPSGAADVTTTLVGAKIRKLKKKNLNNRCRQGLSIVMHLILEREWNSACERLAQHSGEAGTWVETRKCGTGLTLFRKLPIHSACRYGAPMSLLKSLISAYPEGVYEKDESGKLPLHHACSASCPGIDVIQFLVALYPESIHVTDSDGNLPSQRARISEANELVVNFLNSKHRHDLLMMREVGGGNLPVRFLETETRDESVITFHKNYIELIHVSGSLRKGCKCDPLSVHMLKRCLPPGKSIEMDAHDESIIIFDQDSIRLICTVASGLR